MPPEPLPWDRKDFFKERKHHNHHNDRSSESSLGGGGGPLARWRDFSSPSSHQGRDFNRWGSDFRRPSGHGKQGGWHTFAEESGHGYVPSRPSDKMLDDESTRLSVSRGDGKYSRNSRENRGSFSQRDWKGHSWETSNGSSNSAGRLHDMNSDQRSVDDMLTYPSHPQSDFVNTWDHIQLKDQHDNKMGGLNGLSTGQRCERENSLDWKPLKWARSASLSSRGSGFSHSSSSKSMGGVDSNEGKTESQPKNATPVQSPSGDAAAYVTSFAPSDEMTSKKKPRLGWGEGLAKYEKKKVDPDVTVNKDGDVVSACNAEPIHSLCSNLAEKSPGVVGFSDCASPATPSSVACSSSPGIEEKTFGKGANVDNDITNLCGSPSIGSHNLLEGFLFNVEKLDTDSVINLGPSLIELLQSDEASLVDSGFARSTTTNKLLIWKGDILKTLEMTESEIDSLENELKSLKSALGSSCPGPAASSSLSVEGNVKHFKEHGVASNMIARPAPLQIDSSGDGAAESMPLHSQGFEKVDGNVKDEDIDSPGTATSKFIEPLNLVKAVSPSETVKPGECSGDLYMIQPTDIEVKCSVPDLYGEVTDVSTCVDNAMLPENKNGAPVSSDCSIFADGEDMLRDTILGSNKESANRAWEVFNNLLPSDHCNIDGLRVANVLSSQRDSSIKEEFVKRKQFSRFKERVLTLKFKAFQHLWKEDIRLLSVRKFRVKSQKKSEFSLRTIHNGYQKHRSSIRSRFSSPASGNLSLVPTTEIINFTSKLLLESQVKVCRSSLKMPALILDKKEKMMSRFISSNGLVEDPYGVERERAIINPWTSEEKEVFVDKLAAFGKDFRKISTFLDYKTTADCVEFYYKNHKSDCFEKIKKKHDFSKQGKSSTNTYLVTSGKKWNREMNAVSLDILGEASEMAAAAQANNPRQISTGRVPLAGGRGHSKTSMGDDDIVERSSSFDALGSERETAAADVLAGICGSLSSEAMSSCITSSIDPGEGQREWKHQKVDSVNRRPSTSDVTQNVDDDTCSDESCGEMDPADWTDEEKSIFIQAVSSYGKDFTMISRCIRTRSRDQCKVFFSKARKCLGLDLIHTGHGNIGTSPSDDANGGGSSDTEDACVLETSSAISSDMLGSKMDDDLPSHMLNINQDESDPVGTMNLQTGLNKSEDDNDAGLLDDKASKYVECFVSDVCKKENRPELVSELDSNIMNGVDNKSESSQAHKNVVLLSNTEAERDQASEQGLSVALSVSVGGAIDPCPSSSNAVVADASTNEFGNGLEGGGLLLLENRLNDERKCIAETSVVNAKVQDSNAIGHTFDLAVDTSSCSGLSFTVESLPASSKLDSVDKPNIVSLPLENSLVAATTAFQDPVDIQYEKALNQDRLSSTLDRQECKDKSVRKSVSSDDYHQHLSGHSLLNHVDPSQILKGYPLQIPAKKEMNGDISCRQLCEVRNASKSDRSSGRRYLVQDCYLQKCNGLASQSSMAEFPLLLQNIEKTSDHRRVHSRSLSDTEKPCKNGDVKLFGKILTHPSSLPKPNPTTNENEDKGVRHHKQSSKASNLKFASHQPADGGILKFDRSNCMALDNVPARSYGFWDGNRIQTGFSSLPDSAILLAKYPAAFSNYPASSSKMEQQALQAVVRGNERSLNGVAVVPPHDISSSNGVVDYQVYRGRDGSKVQPFTVDMKQRQELLFHEMQRRNGFEARSSLQQQQGRGMVGLNVVGRGGILVGGVGGPCTGVSDPVAAIKMHYAKADQYSGQNGNIIREEESWRGKGDIGR